MAILPPKVLQIPVLRPKNVKKLLGEGLPRPVPILGSGAVPTTDDTLDQFLQHAGTLFGRDPTKWEKMGELFVVSPVQLTAFADAGGH